MILLLFSLFNTSFSNELFYIDRDIFYLAEIRSYCAISDENSSLIFSGRGGMISPVDSLYLLIDRALITINRGGIEMFLGRENIFWGYGIFYTPFSFARSHISPFDIERLKGGKNIVGMRYQDLAFMTPEFLIFLPEQSLKRDSIMLGIRNNFIIGDLELHIPLVWSADSIFSGMGVRFPLGEITFFADYCLTYSNETFLHSAVTGINRIIGDDFYFQVEYFYNQKGLTTGEYDSFGRDSYRWDPGFTGRHYVYSVLQWKIMEGNNIGFYSIIHPIWKSGLVGVSLSNADFENINIMLNMTYILKGREFEDEYIPCRDIYSLEFRYYF
ncbi:hypothetical protein KAW18_06255 [candidate division WOR-3 bacterium]|nr:hypothetical protein [candidate division WOR-3 bacterium]